MMKHFLPQELIREIVLRLPVKSVLRCKCVSKAWFFMISDPQFGISHFDLAATLPSHRILLRSNEFSVRSIDMDFAAVHFTLPHPSPSSAPHEYYQYHRDYSYFHNEHWILGSCKGLLLLIYPKSNELILWNPSIGVHKRLPFSIDYELINAYLVGFGYDVSTHDYLLILIATTDINIFSFKTNSWSSMVVDVQYDDEYQVGSLLNGALHWLVFSRRIVELDDNPFNFVEYVPFIIVFDLTQRTLSEIPLFDQSTAEEYAVYSLRVLEGCLSVCCSLQSCETEIWMMKEYKVHSSWTKSIVIPNYDRPHSHFSPICFTKEGGIYGSSTIGTVRLEKRSDKGELLEHFIDNEGQWFKFNCNNLQPAMYIESLLPLPMSLGETIEDDQQ